MLASEIINNVRVTLSDEEKLRYTDARLIKLLNDAITDITKNSIIIKREMFVALADGIVDYDLSPVMMQLLRVEYLDKQLPMKTFAEMDRHKSTWQLDEGDEVKAVVYDLQFRGKFKTYPIVEQAINPYIVHTSPYGITTNITYSDIMPVITNHIGDFSSIPNTGMLKLYYVPKHVAITALTDALDIDETASLAIEHYVAGFALRDNHDQQNRVMGSEELKLYYQMIKEHMNVNAVNYTNESLEVRYAP